MQLQIKDFAKLTGVSVRTLHYYDEIGLLKPSFVDEQNGYRFYDENALLRMQEILFFRELDFPLKNIIDILSSSDYDKQKAFSKQKNLLLLKKKRLEHLISVLEKAEKGDFTMDMNALNNNELEMTRKKYAKEAKEKWGNTNAYKESEKRTASYSSKEWNMIGSGMDDIFSAFAQCVKDGIEPTSTVALTLVENWKNYISEHFYHCTKEILSGLGQMYVADERFKANLDKYGEGTAEFMSKAIAHYCN